MSGKSGIIETLVVRAGTAFLICFWGWMGLHLAFALGRWMTRHWGI